MTTTDTSANNEIRETVRKNYSEIVNNKTSCCGSNSSCDPKTASGKMGYDSEVLGSVPDDANLGLGCGNPTALAELQLGETVVDLGAGAGLDSLIAATAVGPSGRVIGVDMTQGMLTSARKNAVTMEVHGHVEFREGFVEDLPVVSESADVVISNCVINLSPDKPQAFREAFRVLKPGGRLAVSDIVLSEALPDAVTDNDMLYVACISGASTEKDYIGAIEDAGFVDVSFTRAPAGPLFLGNSSDPFVKQAVELLGQEAVETIADSIWSYKITASRPIRP